MNLKNPNAVYRQLFTEAFKTTWHHKRLWLLGLCASLLVSGGIVEMVSQGWRQALQGQQLVEQAINGTLPGYQWLVVYSRYLALLKPQDQYLAAAIILFVVVILIFLGIASQGAVLIGVLEKHPSSLITLCKKGIKFFTTILSLDLLAKFAIILVFSVSLLPTAFLNPLPYSWHKYLNVFSFLIFIPGAIFIVIMQMIALVATIHKHLNLRGAIIEAWKIFRLHLLVSIEIGLQIFLLSTLALLAAVAFIFIASIPLSSIFIGAALLSSPSLYIAAIIVSVIFILLTLAFVGGSVTVFQYTTWSLFYEEAERFGIIPKIKRWWNKKNKKTGA